MADAIQHKRPHRANGDIGLHVVEIMESCLASSRSGRVVKLKSKCAQPAPLNPGLALGKLA